jgi:hypothetical protein
MSHQERAERLARLHRYLDEHPGAMVGFPPGEEVRCPGRHLIRDRREGLRPESVSDRRSAPRHRPCGYKWGHAAPETTVYAQMVRGELRKPTDPSLGPPPPIRFPGAFFKCPECECTIEFLYLYNPLLEVADGGP